MRNEINPSKEAGKNHPRSDAVKKQREARHLERRASKGFASQRGDASCMKQSQNRLREAAPDPVSQNGMRICKCLEGSAIN
jgi:hypothetical protein